MLGYDHTGQTCDEKGVSNISWLHFFKIFTNILRSLVKLSVFLYTTNLFDTWIFCQNKIQAKISRHVFLSLNMYYVCLIRTYLGPIFALAQICHLSTPQIHQTVNGAINSIFPHFRLKESLYFCFFPTCIYFSVVFNVTDIA